MDDTFFPLSHSTHIRTFFDLYLPFFLQSQEEKTFEIWISPVILGKGDSYLNYRLFYIF